jgi:hypothetical protein
MGCANSALRISAGEAEVSLSLLCWSSPGNRLALRGGIAAAGKLIRQNSSVFWKYIPYGKRFGAANERIFYH